MQIISSMGEMRALLPELGVVRSTGAVAHYHPVVQVTSTVTITRSATSDWLTWNTALNDVYGCWKSATPNRVYVPMQGWYFASLYLKTDTGTIHDATLQIHNSYLASHVAYKKWFLPAALPNYPNMLALNAVCYFPYPATSHYFYCNWGTNQVITSLAGSTNIGFSIWKLS
jgi:hypothetical protein